MNAKKHLHLLSKIRPVQGKIMEQPDLDTIVSFLPENREWAGPLNQLILARLNKGVKGYLDASLDHLRAGDTFVISESDLPYSHIIMAVIPVWEDGIHREDRDLLRCYRGIINTAIQHNLSKIAIPALALQGKFDFPKARAVRLAVQGMLNVMTEDIKEIRILCQTPDLYDLYVERLQKTKRRLISGA